jgi:hypothetical protein
VALSEFGTDTRLHALEVNDAELTRTEYLACLALPGIARPEYRAIDMPIP